MTDENTEPTLDDRLQALVGRPISDRRRARARSGEPADDPPLGGGVRGRESRVHRSRGGGAVALRRDRRAAADAADVDDGDAADHRDRRARRLAGRGRSRRGAQPCSTTRASSGRSRRTPSSRSCATSGSATSCRRRPCSSRCRREKQTRIGAGPLRHVGHHLHRRGGRGRRPAALPHPEVPTGRTSVMSARLAPSMTADTQFFWDGVQGAPAADPALRRRAARCGIRRGRCARAATRSSGTPSRRRAAAPSSAS